MPFDFSAGGAPYVPPTESVLSFSPTTAAAASGGGWGALGAGLGSLLANVGAAAVTQSIAGRLPGNQYANPTLQNPGVAGSPGTTPIVGSGQLVAGIPNGLLYGAGAVAAVLTAVLIASLVRK